MEANEKVTKRSRGKMMLDNFLGGIAWSLGVWVGATIIIAFFVFILSKVNYIPLVGGFVVQIIDYINSNSLIISN